MAKCSREVRQKILESLGTTVNISAFVLKDAEQEEKVMSKFKIGDMVVCVRDNLTLVKPGDIKLVTGALNCYVNVQGFTSVFHINCFELYKPEFMVGDQVRCIRQDILAFSDQEFEVRDLHEDTIVIGQTIYSSNCFELVRRPRPNKDLIVAWANGEQLQHLTSKGWVDYGQGCTPSFANKHTEIRIKPVLSKNELKKLDLIKKAKTIQEEINEISKKIKLEN